MQYYLEPTDLKDIINNNKYTNYTVYRGTNLVRTLVLSEDHDICDIPCKAKYPIYFDYQQYFSSGHFIILAKDAEISAGGTLFPFAAGTLLHFGSKGRIASGILSKDFEYKGIIFKARTKVTFQTWNTSTFWSGVIKNDEIIDSYHCLRNTEITFDKGELQSFYPALKGYKDYRGIEKDIGEKCEIFPI